MRTDKSEHSRELLLKSATAVFAQKGMEGATVKQIADQAGVNVALVSYYFEGKEGLYRACLENFAHHRIQLVEKILTAPTSLEDFKVKLRMWIETLFQDYVEQSDIIAMINREVSQGLPHFKDKFPTTFFRFFQTLEEFFEAAKKNKIIRAELDPQLMAIILHGSVVHIISTESTRCQMLSASIKDERFKKKLADHYIDIWTNGTARR